MATKVDTNEVRKLEVRERGKRVEVHPPTSLQEASMLLAIVGIQLVLVK